MWLRTLLLCLIASIASAASVQWNASIVDAEHGAPDGYKVYYGSASGQLTTVWDNGGSTVFDIPDMWAVGTYYFGVRAYNAYGESGWATTPEGQTWVAYVKSDPPPVLPPEPATDVRIVWEPIEEPPVAVEKIVGDNTVGSNTITYPNGALASWEFTAGWSGAASSVTCTTGKIYIGAWDAGTQLVKIFIYEGAADGGSLLGTSAATTVTRDAWNTCTFSPGVTIVKGSNYRLAFAFANAVYLSIPVGSSSGTSPNYGASSNTYSSPDDPWVTDWSGGDGNSLSIYLEADTASGGGSSAVPKIMLLQDHFSGGIH